jgi:hypothetical protein
VQPAALENYRATAQGAAIRSQDGPIDLEESAIELIADLLHWTAARGHDPDDMLDRAQMHYEAGSRAA